MRNIGAYEAGGFKLFDILQLSVGRHLEHKEEDF